MPLDESIYERFNAHAATESDLRALMAENDSAAKPCPDLHAFLSPILWQLERMDMIATADGEREPHMGDAMAVLAEIEAEDSADEPATEAEADESPDCARNGHRDSGRGVCVECGEFL